MDFLIRQIFEGQDIQHLPRIFSIMDIQVQLVHPTKHLIFMDIQDTKHTLGDRQKPENWIILKLYSRELEPEYT